VSRRLPAPAYGAARLRATQPPATAGARNGAARRHTQLERFIPYLQDLRACGFTGGYTAVADHLRAWRTTPGRHAGSPHRAAGPPPPATTTYSARQTLWLLLRPNAGLTPDEHAYLTCLARTCPLVTLAQALVQGFRTLLHEHDVDGLYVWLHGTQACPIPELCRVAKGMWLDRQAIEAAVTLEWSNGQVEGQVNRLKALKRSMYGRAKLDLLRQHLLHAA